MKTKLLPIAILLLLLLNGVLVFMLIKEPNHQIPKKTHRNFLIEQLDFSEHQKDVFLKLDKVHRQKMNSFDFEIRRNKDLLFNSFDNEDFSSSEFIAAIGKLNTHKEQETYSFFKQVRKLCNEDQKIKFDEIIKKALKGGMRPRPPMVRPNHSPMDREMLPPPR